MWGIQSGNGWNMCIEEKDKNTLGYKTQERRGRRRPQETLVETIWTEEEC